MQDGIIKGTGNSRYLKSISNFLAQYPTYQDFVAALVAGTLPIDLNGINETGWDQLGTALNKANLLSDETAGILGLTSEAVPDDAFLAIGQMMTKRKLLNSISGEGQTVAIDLMEVSPKKRYQIVFTSESNFPSPYTDSSSIYFSTSGGANPKGERSYISGGKSQFTVETGVGVSAFLRLGPDTVFHFFRESRPSSEAFGLVQIYAPASLELIKHSIEISNTNPMTSASLIVQNLPVGVSVALYEEVY